VIILTEYNSFN